MKALISTLVLAVISVPALASQPEQIFKCTYTVAQADKKPFVMTGNIIPDDAIGSETNATYLTLQAPISTDIKLDARILFTGWNYNPITLHPRGDTAGSVAHTEIKGDSAELNHVDEQGVSYHVKCERR